MQSSKNSFGKRVLVVLVALLLLAVLASMLFPALCSRSVRGSLAGTAGALSGKATSYMVSSSCEAISGYGLDHFGEEPTNTEKYAKVPENIFLDSISNPLSTFSIDVDTASYANCRRFLRDNMMPKVDAVRIEEFINYFDYDYPEPKGDVPFSLSYELASAPWNSDNELLLIGMQGKNIETKNLPASNLVFLLDVSGSMNSRDKLPLLKSAIRLLVDKLRPQDRVSIVVYAGAAGVVLNSTSGANKEAILNALNNISAGGSTAGGAGINLAYKIAKEQFISDGNNRVILATDGDFNVGANSNADLIRLIEEKRKGGIFLSVFGFGTGNLNDSMMEQVADKGNGNYAYIDSVLEAKKAFVTEFGSSFFTIAKDVKLQIEFNPAVVKSYRLIGYENRMLKKEDFDNDKKDAGELGAGHNVTALYEIVRANSSVENETSSLKYQKPEIINSPEMFTVALRYKLPSSDTSTKITQAIIAENIKLKTESQNFLLASAVAEFGLLLKNSAHKSNASYTSAITRAKNAKGRDENGYVAELIQLIEGAKLIDSATNKKE